MVGGAGDEARKTLTSAFDPLRTLAVHASVTGMKPRRLGCLVFGVCWTLVFVFTNFGLALGSEDDRSAVNPLTILFWIEITVFVAVAALFYLAEQRDAEP